MFKKQEIETSSCRAYCKPVQRTVKSLRLATTVLRREGLTREIFTAGGTTCQSLQDCWSEWTASQLAKAKGEEKRLRLKTALKGFKTLFDEPCEPCDKKNGETVKTKWAARALFEPQVTSPEVLSDVKSRAEWYMGTRWFDEESVKKRAYVPDQQGCAELERGCGGTLSVRPPWIDEREPRGHAFDPLGKLHKNVGFDEITEGDVDYCRIGVAKKKAKMRVVTMQSARAKRILRPVHEAAYNHLSKFDWLVRGDVTDDHFNTIKTDLRSGERYRSGDFEASTDNLNKDVVLVVIKVLAEALPERRKKVLLKTFEDTWVHWKGEVKKIVRGSMMGNLLSFVVLCLLNKICLDRARQKVEGCGPVWRKSLVNGDDLFFAGTDQLFKVWLEETKKVGFVVNRSKTMSSHRYGDLNSTLFDFKHQKVVARYDFGFLGTNLWKLPNGTLVDGVFNLVSKLKFATSAWFLNTYDVRSIFSRIRPSLSLFPRRWWQFLVKKRWFRAAMSLPDAPVESSGVARKLPFVLGPPLRESCQEIEKQIKKAERACTRIIVREWWGVWCKTDTTGLMRTVSPLKERVKNRVVKNDSVPNIRLSRGSPVWQRMWLSPVLEALQSRSPEIFETTNPKWISDQPGLETHIPLIRRPIRPFSFGPKGEFIPIVNDGVCYLSPQD